MARTIYDPNYQLVHDKRLEMGELFKRNDDDAKLAVLDPYEMKQLDGQPTPGVINVTMNEAMVFLGRCNSIMNGANMQRIVKGRKLLGPEATVIEEYYEDLYYTNDLMLSNSMFTSLYGFLIEQINVRGAIASRNMVKERDGKLYPEIVPLDTRYFTYETDTQGLTWGAYDTTRTRAQIARDWGIPINSPRALVTEFLDDKTHEVYIDKKLYKGGSETSDTEKHPERQQIHGYDYVPLTFAKSGAGLISLMDRGGLKYQGESVFANNRGLIPELHRAASIMMTLTDLSFEGALVLNKQDPDSGDKPASPYGRRKVVELGLQEGYSVIPINDVKNATRLFYNMLVGALQRGGLPNIDFGALSFPLSAVAINKLTASKDAIFIPRLNAIALFYRALSQMIKKQYIQLGQTVEWGEEGYERQYEVSDIDKNFTTEYKFHTVSPEQSLANTAHAQQQLAMGMPRRWVYENTQQIDDPDALINEGRAERAEAGDMAITLQTQIESLADKDGNFDKKSGKDIQAEMLLQQLELILRQRAAGNPMGLDPKKGGVGAGASVRPMMDLFDQGGGGGSPQPQDEGMMEPEEADNRDQRREETVARNRAEE